MILFHDNAPSHTAKLIKETIEAFGWEILSHAAYSPDLAPSDYYLFASMGHALAQQCFTSYEDVRKWLDDWFGSKQFFWRGIHKLSNRWKKCILMGNTSNKIFFIIFNKRVFSIKKFWFHIYLVLQQHCSDITNSVLYGIILHAMYMYMDT